MPIEIEPEEENYPPFYLSGGIQPDPGNFIHYDPVEDGPTLSLNLRPIRDPNEGDRFFYRWFFNYSPESAVASRIIQEGPPQGLSPDRGEEGLELVLFPCEETSFTGDLQRVEVIVADRPFLPRDEEVEAARPNQSLPASARFIRVVWFLEFNRSQICERSS